MDEMCTQPNPTKFSSSLFVDSGKWLYVHTYIFYVVCFKTNFHNAFNRTMECIISYDIISIRHKNRMIFKMENLQHRLDYE